MAIEVRELDKYYGTQAALKDVSFKIEDKEIVGFLGPNGAGKSTMMKILTGYIPPDKGFAAINGIDVEEASLELRKQIGYLPEHNPLYHDMYVREFLEFVSAMYKIKHPQARIRETIQLTGLELEKSKKIGALSKGYRQRVGLAQAILHNPSVLILDEPTTGLDPNQIEEIRHLIRQLGKEKTVMLSTHIMQEVEAICDRVIIIKKGTIVANDKAENLKQNNLRQVVLVEFDKTLIDTVIAGLSQNIRADKVSDTTWTFSSTSPEDLRKVIFDLAVKNGFSVLSMVKQEEKMEDVFKRYTN
jgi:ABC-2 type transport system ATP-binding protein